MLDNLKLISSSHYKGEIWGLAINPKQNYFYTSAEDKTIRKWCLESKIMVLGTQPKENNIYAIDCSSDGK